MDMPIVADVDGDTHAEIVVGSNNHAAALTQGVRVYGGNWTTTRPLWNQHAYHITNVNDDGSIPAAATSSWTQDNSYRANLYAAACDAGEPDLTVSYIRALNTTDEIRLIARIGNAGQIVVPAGVQLTFYDGAPDQNVLLGASQTRQALQPGQFEDVVVRIAKTSTASPLWVVVDEANAIAERNESNNQLDSGIYIGANLVVEQVDVSAVFVDSRSLVREGEVVTRLYNDSAITIPDAFMVTLFADENANGRYDAEDIILGETVQQGLAAGSRTDITFTLYDEARFLGDLLYVMVDSGQVIVEADERDNVRHPLSDASQADFTASRATKLTTETGYEISVRLGNGGAVSIPTGSQVDLYDGDPMDGGILLTTLQTTQDLLPGAYEDVIWTAPLTADVRPLWVYVDPADDVDELDETNNILKTRIYLMDPPNEPPVVSTGETYEALTGREFALPGVVTDDGLPLGTIATEWRVVESPGDAIHSIVDVTDPMSFATFETLGTYTLVLSADDDEWITEAALTLAVVEAIAPEGLAIETPGFIIAPQNETTVSGIVPIELDPNRDLWAVTVDFWIANNPDSVAPIASGFDVTGGGVVAELDTTVLANDSYVIRVRGLDPESGEWVAAGVLIHVEGENKPGRVVFSTTDLVVPVSGLPITIGRTYDSLERNYSNDFGYGWRFDIASPRITVDPLENVTLTLPNGQRSTFYFTPYAPSPIFGFLSLPDYTPEAGTYGTLEAKSCELITVSGGQYFCFPGNRFEASGYVYTDPYGRVFDMDADGTLNYVQDLNGNRLTFTPEGILSNSGALEVDFVRDADGRITQIIDPLGNVYGYTYDANGDLVAFNPPDLDTDVMYAYYEGHYILDIIDPRGNRAAKMTYTDDGRLETLTDALGNVTSYEYSLAINTTAIIHPDGGRESITYNDAGHVLQQIDPLGRITSYSYDENFNILTETNDRGETVTYSYNADGHRTSVTDANGTVLITAQYNQYGGPTRLVDALGEPRDIGYDPVTFLPVSASDSLGSLGAYTWNANGQPLTRADANGSVATYTYDVYGNLTSQTDALGRTVQYEYNTLGQRTAMIDSDGNRTTFVYDALGRLQSMVDALGQTITYSYDANNNQIAMVDRLGRRIEFSYDANNNMIRTTFPDGTFMTYTYDFRGNMLTSTDENGNTTSYTYDLAGQLTTMSAADGGVTTYTYDTAGRQIAMTNAEGNTTTYTYDPAGRLIQMTDALGNSANYTFNDAGQVIAVTDALNRTTSYTYDVRGRQVLTTHPDGTATARTYDLVGRQLTYVDELDNVSTTVYDVVGQRISSIDPLGNTTTYAYDNRGLLASMVNAEGETSSYTYDVLGRRISVTDPLNYVTSYTYDAEGQLTTMVDALNRSMSYTYDARGRQIAVTYPDNSTVSNTYDAAGRQTTFTDELGRETHYGYDVMNRTTSITSAYGTADQTYVSFAYDLLGRRIQSTDARNQTTLYTYDALNRMTNVTDALGYNTQYTYDVVGQLSRVTNARDQVTQYTYDARGRQTEVTYADGTRSRSVYDDSGRLVTSIDPNNIETSYSYDAASRMVSATRAIGTPQASTSSYTYDAVGRQLTVTDPLGNATAYQYDGRGQLAVVTDALGYTSSYTYDAIGRLTALTNGNNETTTYGYDIRGRQTQVIHPDATSVTTAYNVAGEMLSRTDENGIVTSYGYDNLGRLIQVTNPLDDSTQYQYDANSNVTLLTDANGNQTSFSYDALDRPASKTWGVGTSQEASELFVYDALGNLTEHTLADGLVNRYSYDQRNRLVQETYADGEILRYTYRANGQRFTAEDSRGTVAYAYDALNRPVQVTQPDGEQISYTYDSSSNRTSMTTAAGTVDYTYDALNRVATVNDGGLNTTMQYDGVGNMVQTVYPNGITSTYAYDARNRLTEVQHLGSNINLRYSYTLDDVGNRLAVEEADGSGIAWEYDDAYRLLSETRTDASDATTYNAAWTYDATGNRLSQLEDGVSTTYTYDELDQLTQSTTDGVTTTYSYDGRGNLESATDGTEYQTYSYNAQDQLVAVQNPLEAIETQYIYDVDGRRVNEQVSGNSFDYLWDEYSPYGDVVLETNAVDYQLANYTLAGSNLISQERESDMYYHLYDGQGSTRALTDMSGVAVNEYSYTAYGEVYSETASVDNHYLYTGQRYDAATGLYNLRARYYDPSMGRFLSRDSYPYDYQNPIELNRYGYTAGNPINAYDPTGYSLLSFAKQLIEIYTSERWGGVAGFVTGVAIGTTREVVKAWACPQEASDFQGFALTVALATGAGIATSKAGRLSPAAIVGLMGLGGYGVYESGKGFVSNLGKVGKNPLCYGTLAALDAVDAVLGTYDLLQGVKALRNGIDSLRNPKSGDSNSPPNTQNDTGSPSDSNSNTDSPNNSDGINNPDDPTDADGNGNNNNNDDPDGNGNNNDDDGNGNNNNDEDDGFNPTQCFRSFSADTTVVTPYGNTRISDLVIGDTVLAFDEETGDFVEQEVTATWYHLDDVVELVIDGELVRTTADHPFYTAYETWVEAGDLEVGDHILSAAGDYGRVTSVRTTSEREMMYNLTVSEDHTYVVGSGQWVVHNVCRFSVEVENFIIEYKSKATRGSDEAKYYSELVHEMSGGVELGQMNEPRYYIHNLTDDHIDALLWNQAGHLDITVRGNIESGNYINTRRQLALERYRFLADPTHPELIRGRQAELSALNHPDIPDDVRGELLDILQRTLDQYP